MKAETIMSKYQVKSPVNCVPLVTLTLFMGIGARTHSGGIRLVVRRKLTYPFDHSYPIEEINI